MADLYFPFDAGAGASIAESQWSKMAYLWLGDGVADDYNDELAVFADNTGLQVKLKTGAAWVRGAYYENTAQQTLTGFVADGSNPRLYAVVLELDWSANTITPTIVAGTPAVTPALPSLTQTMGTLWQHLLAAVRVETGATSITAGKVTDIRSWPRLDRDTPAGVVMDYAGGPDAPRGWLLCYGQALDRLAYPRLFAVIGTLYGNPTSDTFRVPDYRGRVGVGLDNMGGSAAGVVATATSIGLKAGEETHTLLTGELPVHHHGVTSITVATESTHVHGPGTLTGTSAANIVSHAHNVTGVSVQGVGDHWHGPNTLAGTSGGVSVGHNHALSAGTVDAEAAHTHGAGTYAAASNGAHTHPVLHLVTSFQTGASGLAALGSTGSNDGSFADAATSGGAHTHSVSGASGATSHAHTLSGSTAAQSGDHQHTLSLDSGITTAAGSHSHTLTGTADAINDAHTHTVTMQSGGSGSGTAHTHVLGGTTDDTGSNTAHQNMPPYIVQNKIIKY